MILSVYVKKPLKAGYHCNLVIFILCDIKNGNGQYAIGSRQKIIDKRQWATDSLLPIAHSLPA
jgi:hypothetical protein